MSKEMPLSFPQKAAFGIGACGETVFLGMFNAFIAIFYNQAIGLSNSLIGLAIMLAMLGDAVSDPVIGMVSDRWRSRWGRRHPFLFVAPLPIAVSLYGIFNPPLAWTAQAANDASSAQQSLLFAWLLVWTVSGRFFLTLYTIPHLALGGELTQHARERSQLFSVNAISGYATGALFAFSAWSFFLSGETVNAQGATIPRHLDPEAYGPLVLTACGLVLTSIWVCAIGTLNQIPRLSSVAVEDNRITPTRLYTDLRVILSNPNYRRLMLGFFFFMISVGLHETLNVFVNTYFWEFTPEDIRWFGLAAIPAVIVGASFAPALMHRFDRKPVLVVAIFGMVSAYQVPIVLRLLGLFPDNESPLTLQLVIGSTAIMVLLTAVASVAVLAMLGDVADQSELATGRRQEGLVYSARAFFAKASNSAGHFIAGVALDLYVKLPFDAAPGQLAPDIVERIGFTAGPIMGLGGFIAVFFYLQYGLSRSQHAEIVAALEAGRRAPKGCLPIADPV